MEDIIIGKDIILQEYEPLHNLLQLLPSKAQLGPKSFVGQVKSLHEHGVKHLFSLLKEKAHDNLRSFPVCYTCLEVSHHVVVLGSNLGIIFFYDRINSKLTRLSSESGHEPVTCLRLLSMQSCFAAGFSNGAILIYSYMLTSQGLNKHECMPVYGAHSSSVTCLEWSPDGTVLYSGDTDGRIVMSVVKVAGGLTQSVLLFVEDSPVVQLSYSSTALLVSTWRRTVVWNFISEEPLQVGQKERKSLGKFGACFFPPARLSEDGSDRPVTIYAARPGLRIWTALLDGKVSATLMYKGLMSGNPPGIRTLSPLPSPSLAQATRREPSSTMQLGCLEMFHGQFILTWDQHRLWLLDTTPCAVVCFHYCFHGDIVDVCSVGHEVFILQQSGARLIRKFSLIPKLPNPLVRVAELLERSLKDKGEETGNGNSSKCNEKEVSSPAKQALADNIPQQSTATTREPLSTETNETHMKTPQQPVANACSSTAVVSPVIQVQTCPEPDDPAQHLAKLASKIQNVTVEDFDEIVFKKKPRNKKKHRGGDETPKVKAFNRLVNYNDDTGTTDEISDISSELDYADRSVSTNSNGDHTSDDGGEGWGAHLFTQNEDGTDSGQLELAKADAGGELEVGTTELQRQHSSSSTGTLERTLSPESTATNTPTKKLSREEDADIRHYGGDSPSHSLEDLTAHKEMLHSYPNIYSDTPLNISDMSFSDKSIEASHHRTKRTMYSPSGSSMSVLESTLVEADERQTDSEGTPPVCLDHEGAEELQDTSSWTSSSRTFSEMESSSVEICRSIEASYSSVKSSHSKTSQVSVRSLHLLVDSWSDCSGPNPGHAICLAVSDTHLWCVNNYEQIFYCPTHFEVLSWTRLDGEAKMIAVNTTGDVIWVIDRKNYAYTRKGITDGNLIGREWFPVEKDMRYIAVDQTAVWGIKMNGDVFVRTDVTRTTPEGRNWRTISINTDFVQASCFDGLVWFLDRTSTIHVYKSADYQATSSENWKTLEGVTARWTCLCVEGVAWIIDTKGSLWFSGNVTRDNPTGGTWYQVSLGQYLMHDPSLLDAIQTIWSWVRRGDETKLITASPKAGLWILGRTGSINASRGHLLGSHWEPITPQGMAKSVFWSYISARTCTANNGKGQVWALQPNGELMCFNPGSRPIAVEQPKGGAVLKLVAASSKTVWGITHNFKVVQLIGVSELCPQGVQWIKVPLENFQIVRVCHLSSGSLSTWAVEESGRVWLRIGGMEDVDHKISQVWLPVDGEPLSNCRFVRVAVSPDDVVVWALDDRFNVYARKCVTPDFPLGTSWEVVPGIGVRDLCICASHTVWAVCTNGDVACRFGVSPTNFLGDYWKKVPGNYELISVTPDGELWAIDQNGQLFRRRTQHFYGTQSPFKPRTYSALFPGEDEWELI